MSLNLKQHKTFPQAYVKCFAWMRYPPYVCVFFVLFFLSHSTAHMNYISLGTAVIGVDNNLHLILPEGLFPLPASSGSGHVTSVLTPISQVTTSAVAVRQMYHPPAVTPLQRYRTTAPVLIPAPARKPSLASAFASSPAASAAPQAAVHAAVKVRSGKRPLFLVSSVAILMMNLSLLAGAY